MALHLSFPILHIKEGCRTNVFTCLKGLAAHAAKTEYTKITLES